MTFRHRKNLCCEKLGRCCNLNNMLLLINVENLCKFCHNGLLAITHSSSENVSQAWQDIELLVLTWQHHVGMGPGEGGKTQADTNTCLYFCLLTLQKQLTDCDAWMLVYWEESFFKDTALSLSVFAGSSVIMPFLHLSHSAFLFPFLCVCVCVLPEGKIRHEPWKQALQSWPTLVADYLEIDKAPVRCYYHLLTHKLALFIIFPFSTFLLIWSSVCLSISPCSI